MLSRDQISRLVALALAAYPQMQEREAGPIAAIWRQTLADLSYEQLEAALSLHIATSRFFPTVAELREAAARLSGAAPALTHDEAWQLVRRAAGNSAYGAAAEFAALPPQVQRAVGSPAALRELGLLDAGELGNERARFRLAWEARAARERELALLPPSLRQRLEAAADRRRLDAPRRREVVHG